MAVDPCSGLRLAMNHNGTGSILQSLLASFPGPIFIDIGGGGGGGGGGIPPPPPPL